jgi:release factor glutamine methyltransferase
MKTYNDIYLQARNALREHGIEGYSLEARLLVATAAGKTAQELLRDLSLYTTPEMAAKVADLTERRIAGEPVAYITGAWEFYGLPMVITTDVLIPRMDTELLVDAAKELLNGHKMDARVLDLCCGSGCIACAGRRIGIADRIGCISGPGIRSLRRDCRVRTCSIIRGAGRRRSLSHSLGRRHRAALRVLTVPAVSPAAAAGRQQDQSRSTQAHNPHKSFFSSLFHHEDYPLP